MNSFPDNRATTLRDAYRICTPEPLVGQNIERYYGDLSEVRSTKAIQNLTRQLEFRNSSEFCTILFTGHLIKNAPIYTAHKLIVPKNVILLFQPPYCPELNPIERVWQYIKQKLKNLFFTSLDDVKHKVAKILNSLSEDIVHSLTGWDYILDALSL